MTSINLPFAPVRLLRSSVSALLVFFVLGTAFAQAEDESSADMVSPPRLAVVEGPVQYWRPGADTWVPAPLNAALAEGDAIHAGDTATVEAQVGPRDFVRLTGNTRLTLVTHDPGLMQFRIEAGTASFDLRSNRSGQVMQIDTPNVSIVAGGRGYYRIFAREGETHLVVRRGGRATLNFQLGGSRSVVDGQEIVVRGENGSRVEAFPASPPDAWDRWNDARSEYYAAATSNRYVPADVYGAADLDQYGRWREDGNYGWIWVPGVSSAWVPYSTGSWHWDPIYGWTWVDSEPWGWTTSHYGRWVYVDGRWAWAPGPRGARVTYAPALVTFSNADSGVGWVALGWGEPVLPWWGRPGFRGQPWWGGWAGPRTEYHDEHYHYRNRDIGNAFVSGHDDDFNRHRGRGATPPVTRGDSGRPGPGDRGPGSESRHDRPDTRPDSRPEHRQEPIIATPQRGPGVNPQYRQDQQPERTRERREIPAPQLRLPTTPPANQFHEQPREQRPAERERPVTRIEPHPAVVAPPVHSQPVPQQRESRVENHSSPEPRREEPRISPRGAVPHPQDSRDSERDRGRHPRLPGDRN